MADDDDAGGANEDQAPSDEDRDQSKGQRSDDSDEKSDDAAKADQFADDTNDPLSDAIGATAGSGADQAYRIGIRSIQSSAGAAVIGGGSFRDLNIGGTTIHMQNRREQAPGPVRRAVIDELIEQYVPLDNYRDLLKRLLDMHLLVLRGTPGTGRPSTGLRLLAEVADEDISRFDPETDIRSLTATNLQEGAGYLLEVSQGLSVSVPTAVNADYLRGLLVKQNSFMIIVAPNHSRYRAAFDDYSADCPIPDPEELFDKAIEFEANHKTNVAQTIRDLGKDHRLRPSEGTQQPSEVLRLVSLIVAHAESRVTLEEILRGSSESLDRRVSEWFEPLADIPATSEADEAVRLAAFRIALAVFNETPFDLVAEAGELLAARLLIERSPRRHPGRPVFAKRRDDYVADSRAHLLPGLTKFDTESVPSTFVAFTDERLPRAVLQHLWGIHNTRGPLIEWLCALSQDTRPFVWMRAALAIGLLSSWDFAYTFHELIDRWASASGQATASGEEFNSARRRLVAAVALDTASRNDEILPVVREILNDWCRKGSLERRWTGAAMLGYDLGARYVKKSLTNLRIVGCWEDGTLASVASWAVARIFTHGAITQVIDTLDTWLGDDRLLVRRLGLLAVYRVANLKVSDVEDLDLIIDTGGGRWKQLPERDRWPLLVALAAEDEAFTNRFADVVWLMARSAIAQEAALDVLAKWMRAGEKDRSCIGPVGKFLALLGDDESDRARLTHLVGVLRRDLDEPLPEDIAARLERSIEANIHSTDD
jgi:hypothetical protein